MNLFNGLFKDILKIGAQKMEVNPWDQIDELIKEPSAIDAIIEENDESTDLQTSYWTKLISLHKYKINPINYIYSCRAF